MKLSGFTHLIDKDFICDAELSGICFDSGYKFLFESNKARHYKTEKMYDLDYIIGKEMCLFHYFFLLINAII